MVTIRGKVTSCLESFVPKDNLSAIIWPVRGYSFVLDDINKNDNEIKYGKGDAVVFIFKNNIDLISSCNNIFCSGNEFRFYCGKVEVKGDMCDFPNSNYKNFIIATDIKPIYE